MNFYYDNEYEEEESFDQMMRDDENFIKDYFHRNYGIKRGNDFMEFMQNAQEFLQNDWYRVFCNEKLKDPNFLDVSFVISDYDIYETAKHIATKKPNDDEYKQALLNFEMYDDESDIEFLRLLDVFEYFEEYLDTINTAEDLIKLWDI